MPQKRGREREQGHEPSETPAETSDEEAVAATAAKLAALPLVAGPPGLAVRLAQATARRLEAESEVRTVDSQTEEVERALCGGERPEEYEKLDLATVLRALNDERKRLLDSAHEATAREQALQAEWQQQALEPTLALVRRSSLEELETRSPRLAQEVVAAIKDVEPVTSARLEAARSHAASAAVACCVERREAAKLLTDVVVAALERCRRAGEEDGSAGDEVAHRSAFTILHSRAVAEFLERAESSGASEPTARRDQFSERERGTLERLRARRRVVRLARGGTYVFALADLVKIRSRLRRTPMGAVDGARAV
jgi:hypothetical protein